MSRALELNAQLEEENEELTRSLQNTPREPAVKVVRDQLTDLKVRQPVFEPVFDSAIGRQ